MFVASESLRSLINVVDTTLRISVFTFSETNLLDFSESASPAAPLAAEAACIMAVDFGVLGNGYSRESVSALT